MASRRRDAIATARGPVAWALALVVLLAAVPALAALTFPTLTGRVVDDANLLSADDKRALDIDLEGLERKTTDQLVVVTLPSLQGTSIEDYGYQLGRAWGIGQQGKNNGVLLIVAPNDRKVRIEVGYGLEGKLTDALTKLIIQNAILPQFRAGDYAAGIKAGVRDVVDVLEGDAEAVETRRQRLPDAKNDIIPFIIMLVWFAIFGLTLWIILRDARPGATGQRGRSSGSTWGSGSSGGGWSSGGGGFSGGGGSFGGGGSSGSW